MLGFLKLLPLVLLSAEPAAWPGFLGAGAEPLPSESIPLRWSPTEGIAWTADIEGFGQSSPVIWGETAYVTSVVGPLKDELLVTAVEVTTGSMRWVRRRPTSDPVESSAFVSRAAPTPTVDARGVYCFFESGDIVALSHAGDELWQRSLSTDYGKFENKYGLGASPVLWQDRMIVLIDHPGASYLIALATADGATLWKTPRESRSSWSSPMLLPIGGEPQVICSSSGTVDGYDPQTGRLLWQHTGLGGNRICSPLRCGDGRLLIGSQTSREYPDEASVKQSNVVLEVRRIDSGWQPAVAWRTEEASPGMASPLAAGDCVYWINRVGVVFCFDGTTGQQHFAERIAQSCWATPLAVGERVYFCGKDGVTTVLARGPKFEVLAENTLWNAEAAPVDASLVARETDPARQRAAEMHSKPEVMGVAAVPGLLLIRTGTRLYGLRS